MYHKDSDWDNRHFNELVTFCNEHSFLKNYLNRYKLHFPDEFSKGRVPRSTCCTWAYESIEDTWTHLQYFVLADVGLAFDLSSDMFDSGIDQLTGTFYGGLFGHLTSKSLWVSTDGEMVSTIPPIKGFTLFAWGWYHQWKSRVNTNNEANL